MLEKIYLAYCIIQRAILLSQLQRNYSDGKSIPHARMRRGNFVQLFQFWGIGTGKVLLNICTAWQPRIVSFFKVNIINTSVYLDKICPFVTMQIIIDYRKIRRIKNSALYFESKIVSINGWVKLASHCLI